MDEEGSLRQYLVGERESRRKSLDEVSRATRISLEFLRALESGDYQRLPAPPFIRGFLRAYSDFLGLDTSEVLRRYQREVELRSETPGRQDAKASPLLASAPGGRGILLALLAAVLVLMIGLIIQH